MKKTFLAVLLCIIVTGCYAQAQLPEGKIKGKHDVFNVKHNNYTFTDKKTILIYSTKNKYNDGIPYGKNEIEIRQKDVHFDTLTIKNVIFDVLHNKISALHKRHERINGLLKFDLSGNVVDLAFNVNENTIITAEDFEDIDNRLRKELKANFIGNAYQTHVAINASFRDIVF